MTTINANITPPTVSERIAAFNNDIKAERQLTKALSVIAAIAATCFVTSISCGISGFYLFPSSSGLFLTALITAKLALVTIFLGDVLSESLSRTRDDRVRLGRRIDPVWFQFDKHVSKPILGKDNQEIGRRVVTGRRRQTEFIEMQQLSSQQSSGS
ncbi:MAG: hypothetical protein KR126chlam2_01386 [Chlamydiae bacterium]|nr:hypothetical protein [Chlamydiota bacterium]